MSLFRWFCSIFGDAHRWVREGDEPYIKCECGATIEFEQISG